MKKSFTKFFLAPLTVLALASFVMTPVAEARGGARAGGEMCIRDSAGKQRRSNQRPAEPLMPVGVGRQARQIRLPRGDFLPGQFRAAPDEAFVTGVCGDFPRGLVTDQYGIRLRPGLLGLRGGFEGLDQAHDSRRVFSHSGPPG